MEQENVSISATSHKSDIDDRTRVIFTWAMYTVVCQIVDVFGVVTNIINIACFIKQGFREPVNISLLGLSISDLGSLLTFIWANILLTPAVIAADLPFDALDILYVVAAMPHFTFTRVSSWITAMITMERCLCVIAPLKSKIIVTPTRASIVTTFVFVTFVCIGTPAFAVNTLGKKFIPGRNKTLIGLIFSADREIVETISYGLNNFFLPFTAFAIIAVCTIILVISLHRNAKWRKTSAISSQEIISTRNQRISRMIVVISTLYISCFFPLVIITLAFAFEPGLKIGGKYVNIGIIVCGAGGLLESINSSSNIFVYYHMSSKYRHAFHGIFVREKSRNEKFICPKREKYLPILEYK